MIGNMLDPGAYSQSNSALIAAFRRDVDDLRDRWQDEAAHLALQKDPTRAHYVEAWIRRLG